MAKPPRPWIVTPHTPIEKLDDNLWAVESKVPGAPMTRRMCIIKMADGKLAFFHAIPLEDAALAEVKAWGTPAYLIVGHDQHAMDAPAFAEKLGLKIYGPKPVEAKLRARLPLAGTLESFPADAVLQIETLGGSKSGEPVLLVQSADGKRTNLLFTDAFVNMPTGHWTMRLTGFTGAPKSPALFRMIFIKDKKALRAHFEKLSAMPGVGRLVPCHGQVVKDSGASVLKDVAARI